MASLAEQATATQDGVLGPMVGRNSSCIARVHKRPGSAKTDQLLLKINKQRSKTAVEADHQQLLTGVGRLDGGELSRGKAEGFLHEHMLTGGQGLLHQGGVAVVAGGDHHAVGGGISQ